MRQNKKENLIKKKLTLGAVLCGLLLSLAGCGSTINEQKVIYGIERSSIEEEMQSMAATITSLDKGTTEQLEEAYHAQVELSEGSDKDQANMVYDMLSSWDSTVDYVGTFQGTGTMKVEKAGKTVTATMPLYFTDKNANLVFVYNIVGDRMKQSAVSVNLLRSMGETMGRAGLNVLMGMGTVFCVLILICLCIYAFRIIPYLEKKFEAKKGNGTPAPAKKEKREEPQLAAPAYSGPGNTELAAVIAAAISAATGQSTDDFVVRSIRRRY